jgi:hypothetical protein
MGDMQLGQNNVDAIGLTSSYVALAALLACGPTEKNESKAQPAPPLVPESAASPAVAQTKKPVMTGPRLVVDSSIKDPRLEIQNDDYVLRLPVEMVRLLHDSLPGFSPRQQSTYSSDLVAGSDSPLSVVVGDFNGDSKLDVAMLGEAEKTPVLFMLLARSDSSRTPSIVFILRPPPNTPNVLGRAYIKRVRPQRIEDPDQQRPTLDLRTDAINMFHDEASTIIYLDHGLVRWFSVGGD